MPSKTAARPRVAARPKPFVLEPAEPLGAAAVSLLAYLGTLQSKPLLHVAQSGARAEALARVLRSLAPELAIAVFPSWDNLPYDRTPASRAVMGRRAGVLRWLTDRRSPPDIVLTAPAAVLQRVPPQHVWAKAHIEFRAGDALDPDVVQARLREVGYTFDDRVDEPGEAAIRGRVIDLFPAAAPMPCRVEHEDGRITAIRSYDPVTQRSVTEAEVLVVDPASEMILEAHDDGGEVQSRTDLSLAQAYDRLETIFDYVPRARIALEEGASERAEAFLEQIADAYESRRSVGLRARAASALPPEKLYLTRSEWQAIIDRRLAAVGGVAPDKAENQVPRFARQRNAGRLFTEFVREQRRACARVVLCAPTERDLRSFVRRIERAVGEVQPVRNWAAVEAASPGALLALALPIDAGFLVPASKIAVIAAGDVLGSRARTAGRQDAPALPIGEIEFRIGDAVIHLEHGMGILEGLEPITAEQEGGDVLRLRYAQDASLLVPVAEIGKIWRYGSEPDAVSLDRLDNEAWPQRRAQVEAEIAATAAQMVELARARNETQANKLVPPRQEYERFASRFPYTLTEDQAAAVHATLGDLASGRPMDRVVCGDVGFGKTEVALRGAAAAAFAGKQVAVIVPTTVLARQHIRTFQRRFAPFGIEVAHLSRLVKPAEARKVKQGLATGEVRIVVGTHALASRSVQFKDLGLLIIDEEHRFGARQKAKLREHRDEVHVLTLTATPIPRTLQSALVGLQDLSTIATPPVRRQPIRTVVMAFDAAAVRDALMREHKRGGQSFVVCPRVEDIDPMARRLSEIAPELDVMVAHGKMPADDMDDVMVRFAEGEGDVLLATNIIESGLDVPSANTMLVWRPDRFGLAQLHQLRGRVGRGARRGLAYLLLDPAAKLTPATEKRLRTLEALDRLGAGFAISARDLDVRGAGDLLGEEQSGHVKLIGLGLYQHLLENALAAARGQAVDDWRPDIRAGISGYIPETYVPEAEMRINLYARLERLGSADEITDFEEEVEDRFGPPPPPVVQLFQLARIRESCRELGIARLDAGPKAIAASPRTATAERLRRALESCATEIAFRGERLVYPHGSENAEELPKLVTAFLEVLATELLRPDPVTLAQSAGESP